ncbi:histidine kinase dimerization/phosphoacceptor domain -containing protein [Rhodohalobacter halophilus]|uniref:histidine kinase dimerization/phosphoacceptor domain -containing protein n=1 Tax=Rhodohalobacter halophilus TaxID=1812810 RepID=UPI00159EF8A8|nr:histidine kinase dimerization/phosphoacceptor domain -containing protein [Rhodohalobacter halophilus]
MKISSWFDKGRNSTVGLVIGFALLAGALYTLQFYSSSLQVGMRAFNFGSSQFMKSQQLAVNELVQFVYTEDEDHIDRFYNHIKMVDNLRQGRELLTSGYENRREIAEYLHIGEDEPYGVVELIRFYNFLSHRESVQNLLSIWEETDQKIFQLQKVADEARQSSIAGEFSDVQKQQFLDDIFNLSREITSLDQQFFTSINRAGVLVDSIILRFNVAVIVILVLLLGGFIYIQMSNIRRWNDKLEASDKKFKIVLNNSQDVIYQMDLKTGKYVYMSPSAENMLGYSMKEMKDGGAEFFLSITHPDDLKAMEEEVEQYKSTDLDKRVAVDTQFRVKRTDGNYIWVNNKRTLLRDENNEPSYIIGNVRDISERKKYIEAQEISLKEKEMLLSEIHHRVKNNLSIVSSLIELQKSSRDVITEEDLKEIQDRIRSIALVHEKLYQTDTLADVDLSDYISDLLDMIKNSIGSNKKKIELTSDVDHVKINNKKAVPIGLIINELVNNCYKYAFNDQESGKIEVSLKRDGEDRVVLKVRDNGAGLPENFEGKSEKSLGMTLIRAFTKQVKGDLETGTENGAVFTIQFELPKNGSEESNK